MKFRLKHPKFGYSWIWIGPWFAFITYKMQFDLWLKKTKMRIRLKYKRLRNPELDPVRKLAGMDK